MKQMITLLSLLFLLALISCDNQAEVKLNLVTLENGEVRIEKYRISRLTSIHQFVDITSKRWDKVERIIEANDGSIDSVFIKQDTLFLQKASSKPVIYNLASSKFGYKVALLEPKSE